MKRTRASILLSALLMILLVGSFWLAVWQPTFSHSSQIFYELEN